jgi:hypothetical protein
MNLHVNDRIPKVIVWGIERKTEMTVDIHGKHILVLRRRYLK